MMCAWSTSSSNANEFVHGVLDGIENAPVQFLGDASLEVRDRVVIKLVHLVNNLLQVLAEDLLGLVPLARGDSILVREVVGVLARDLHAVARGGE